MFPRVMETLVLSMNDFLFVELELTFRIVLLAFSAYCSSLGLGKRVVLGRWLNEI